MSHIVKGRCRVRWTRLFADLEAQLEQTEAVDLASEVADRTRREVSSIALVDRLVPAVGSQLVISCGEAGPVSGRLSEVGPDWLLLEEQRGGEVLLNLAAVHSVSGVGPMTEAPAGKVWRALDLCWALRGLARGRVAVQVVMRDGVSWTGTLDRVAADHCELAAHAAGEPRRPGAVAEGVLLPVAAISLVRSR